MRTVNWNSDKAKMERTIPIFRGLIASDPQDNYHRNHAQLGYALKDKREPNWKEAEIELTKAITIRDKLAEPGWMYYEFNRAICRTNLDKAFKEGKESAPEVREQILKDLESASASELRAKLLTQADIKRWSELNKVDMASFES
jgi:hypothetical protein